MNPEIDHYLAEGCGRCSLGGTPACKVHHWLKELVELRRIVLDCGLTEERKWGVPCYSYQKANVLIVSAFKEYASISFFKGSLLNDAQQLLEKPGENTQAGRVIKFTDVKRVLELEPILKAYIYEAIEVERAGLKVESKDLSDYDRPEELDSMLDNDLELKAAFEALTPGRQKGYLLHFSQPKQAKTREARILKCVPLIMEGKGWNGR